MCARVFSKHIFSFKTILNTFLMYQKCPEYDYFSGIFRVQHSALAGDTIEWVTVANDYANNNFITGR